MRSHSKFNPVILLNEQTITWLQFGEQNSMKPMSTPRASILYTPKTQMQDPDKNG